MEMLEVPFTNLARTDLYCSASAITSETDTKVATDTIVQ